MRIPLRAHRALMRLLPVRTVDPARAVSDGPVVILLMSAHGMGGATRAVFNLAAELAKTREVEIVGIVRQRQTSAFAFPAGVRMTILDDRIERRSLFARLVGKIPSVLIHPGDKAYSWFSLRTDLLLWRRIRSLRTGFLISTRPGLNTLVGRIARPEVVLLVQEHINYDSYPPDLARDLGLAYGGFDCVVLLTERDRAHHEAALAGRSTEVAVIPNAVTRLPGEPLPTAQRRQVIVAAGRLSTQKGYDLLIEAYRSVAQRYPDWRVEIYGTGSELADLSDRISRAGLTGAVRLLGATQTLGEILASSAIFALPSRYEGMPLVVLEAMGKATPVVAFDCPTGPRELITDGVDGVLVPPEDVAAFADSLVRLIEDEELRERLGAAAVHSAVTYHPDVVGAQWQDLLDRLLHRSAIEPYEHADGHVSAQNASRPSSRPATSA